MAAATTGPFPTTPPSTYILTTTGEGALLTSYGVGGIATQNAPSSYWYSAYSYSTPGSGQTVVVAGDGSASSSGSASSFLSGWNALSNTTKYAIYGGAGAVVLIIIIIIILVVRRSKRKNRQAVELGSKGTRDNVRMTQRSSFASPMHAMNDATIRSNNNTAAGAYAPPSAFMQRNDSNYSLDKSGAYQSDAYSVHSVPPTYGNQYQQQNQHQQYQSEEEPYYPPQRSGSPAHQQYSQQQDDLDRSQHGYAYAPEHEGHRAVSPSYSQHSFSQSGNGNGNGGAGGRAQNPYAAFAHDGQGQGYEQDGHGYDQPQRGYGQQQHPQQGYNGY